MEAFLFVQVNPWILQELSALFHQNRVWNSPLLRTHLPCSTGQLAMVWCGWDLQANTQKGNKQQYECLTRGLEKVGLYVWEVRETLCLSLKCSWKSIDHTRAGSCLQGKHLRRWRENFEWQVLRRCSVSSWAPGARHWQVKLSVQFEQIRCIYILDKCIVTRTNSAETAIVAKVFQSHREVNTGWG